MNLWVYQADVYCDSCIQSVRREKAHLEGDPDSDRYPQGPYPQEGRKGRGDDVPLHCGSCGDFLQNPLSEEGMALVRSEFKRAGLKLDIWAPFYLPEEWRALQASVKPRRSLAEVRAEYNALQGDLKHAMLDFLSTPSAAHYGHLEGAMQQYQATFQEMLDAREREMESLRRA